jgi:hypothetical protein
MFVGYRASRYAEIPLLYRSRDRSAATDADRDSVHGLDRRNLRRRPTKK